MMFYGALIDQYNFEASRKDDKGLGHWVHMMLRGEDGVNKSIVCGYKPYKSRKKATRSSYQQDRRYLITKIRQDLSKSSVQRRLISAVESLKRTGRHADSLHGC